MQNAWAQEAWAQNDPGQSALVVQKLLARDPLTQNNPQSVFVVQSEFARGPCTQ